MFIPITAVDLAPTFEPFFSLWLPILILTASVTHRFAIVMRSPAVREPQVAVEIARQARDTFQGLDARLRGHDNKGSFAGMTT